MLDNTDSLGYIADTLNKGIAQMVNKSPYVAKRIQAGIPIWDIQAHGERIGCATIFEVDDEGPMATIRYPYPDQPVTFQGSSLHDVLTQMGTYLRAADADLKSQADAEYYSHVIAPMEAAETESDRLYHPDLDDEFI